MTKRIKHPGLVSLMFLVAFVVGTQPISAQSPYGGMYMPEYPEESSSSSSSAATNPTPTPLPPATPRPTPTARPAGQLSLTVTPSQAFVDPEGELAVVVTMAASGNVPGQYSLSAMALNDQVGSLAPTRTSMSGSGSWQVHLQAGTEPGTYLLLFVAQDILGYHSSASVMARVEIAVDPLLVAGGHQLSSTTNSANLRIEHKSWWDQIKFRNLTNPNWFEYLCDDLYGSRGWQQTISKATKIDRDRLNITKTMAPIENYTSYTDIQPIISRYWADTGLTVSMATANRIGDVFAVWRTNKGMVVTTSEEVAGALRITTPGIKVGNVLNGVGATMILLDFWANMSAAETPVESQEAWFKAGYASLDMYMATIIGNTFGSTAALPGMMVSYMLGQSYDTLIGGHKKCWFKKMVIQAMDADLLSESIHDAAAVNNVKQAMLSSQGLEGKLMDWWAKEAPTWDGKMGGCGSWNLAEARGYHKSFVKNLMGTTEVEIDGKRYHPWSFYYSVSRMLVLDRRREMAREAAEKIREVEAAYISSLEQTTYRGTFRIVSAANPQVPIKDAAICPTEWDSEAVACDAAWTTDQDGTFTAVVKGHLFSPQGTILLTLKLAGENHVFVVPQDAFERVSQ